MSKTIKSWQKKTLEQATKVDEPCLNCLQMFCASNKNENNAF